MFTLRSVSALSPRAVVLWTLCLLAALPVAAADTGLEPAIRNSHFIFTGTFERLGASNLSLLPASDVTAIVRVREVADQPGTFGEMRDAQVTVQLADSSGAVEGGQAIFFTTSLMWGEHLGLSEIQRLPSRSPETEASDLEQVRREVGRVRSLEADEDLSARLTRAAVVVFGRVGDVRETERSEEDFGEHAASWALAKLEIEGTLKGRETHGVYFAQDTDFFWGSTPKLSAGEDGIFLLQPYRGRDLPKGSYVLVNALDVQPRSELERVRGLLR
ncbi:MAG TPA: hypothetical protein VN851_14950 [Thermoanaerobaculia bacterium]|nr:hypothetical protein [Thermoanaerobaculia bacterium]